MQMETPDFTYNEINFQSPCSNDQIFMKFTIDTKKDILLDSNHSPIV